jgi:hypothetical protein
MCPDIKLIEPVNDSAPSVDATNCPAGLRHRSRLFCAGRLFPVVRDPYRMPSTRR